MFCKKCGASVPSDAEVCYQCGMGLKAVQMRQISPDKLLSKPLLFITGSLMLIQLIISLYQLFGTGLRYGMSAPDMIIRFLLFMAFLFPMIFEIVGMFKLGAYSAKPYSSPGCGFFKTSYIVRIIYNAIFTVFLLFSFFMSSVFVYGSRVIGDDSGGIVVFMVIVAMLVQVMKICYYSSMIGVANMTNSKLTGTYSTQNYSLFPVVLSFFVIVFRVVVVMILLMMSYALYRLVPVHMPVTPGALFVIVLIQLIVTCLRVVMAFLARAGVSKENQRILTEKRESAPPKVNMSSAVSPRQRMPEPVSPYVNQNNQVENNFYNRAHDYERTYRSGSEQAPNGNSMMKKPDSLD